MTDTSGTSLHVVVLAAGASSRFGSPKQLVRIDGRPMLHTVVANAVSIAGHAVTVVLGSGAMELASLLRHSPASVIVNRDWEEGMGSSVRTAMVRLQGGCDGLLVLLADQIAVTTDDLHRLAGVWRRRPEAIVAASYSMTVGAPAIFPSWCFPELAELRGDQGARALLHRHPDHLVRVPIANAAIDIDEPEDLLKIDPKRRPKAPPIE